MTITEPPGSHHHFSPGFRLSALDVIILIVGTAGAVIFGNQTWWIGLVIGFVVGHFFLFCNVFRMSRPLELAWATVFTGLAAGSIAAEFPSWIVTIVLSLCTTVSVVVLEMRRPSYHGVGWQKINPGLRERWEAQTNQS